MHVILFCNVQTSRIFGVPNDVMLSLLFKLPPVSFDVGTLSDGKHGTFHVHWGVQNHQIFVPRWIEHFVKLVTTFLDEPFFVPNFSADEPEVGVGYFFGGQVFPTFYGPDLNAPGETVDLNGGN
uniref:(northern house mosquito) hypothetical protein n=1 Tax=Culex pipiens TaxID=7175 RepID=A0A8D8A502_CULPI